MARYKEIYEDLRARLLAGEFEVGDRMPSIAELMDHYDVPGLNTIRQALILLAEDGLVESRQGVGTFVLRQEPSRRVVDVAAELRTARSAIDRALAAKPAGTTTVRNSHRIVLHEVAVDGLPDFDEHGLVERYVGNVAFIFEGQIYSGHPLPPNAEGETLWVLEDRNGREIVKVAGVTHWVEFPDGLLMSTLL